MSIEREALKALVDALEKPQSYRYVRRAGVHAALKSARLALADEESDHVMDMALCDIHHVILREGRAYRFRVVGDCAECRSMSAASREAYGPPPAPKGDGSCIDAARAEPQEQAIIQAHPDKARFYYMHDNHMFTRLEGSTLDDIIAHANAVEAESSYGMLCPVIVMRDKNEIRRVGTGAHSSSSKDPKDRWHAQVAVWRKEVEADPDIIRILARAEPKK